MIQHCREEQTIAGTTVHIWCKKHWRSDLPTKLCESFLLWLKGWCVMEPQQRAAPALFHYINIKWDSWYSLATFEYQSIAGRNEGWSNMISSISWNLWGSQSTNPPPILWLHNQKGKTILHEQLPNLKLQIPEFPQSVHKIEPIIV
jgi:hypothetical protein